MLGGMSIQGQPLVASMPIVQLMELVIIHFTGVVYASFTTGGFFFFFRPAPLWLPPGRRTLLCWLNELRKCMHYIPLWGFESGAKSYHIMPVPKRGPPETQQKPQQKNKPAPRTQTGKVRRLQCHSIQRL